MTEIKNLMQGLCQEIDRIKEIVKIYEDQPDYAGMVAAYFMKADIKQAESARNMGDTIEMKRAYQNLKEYEL